MNHSAAAMLHIVAAGLGKLLAYRMVERRWMAWCFTLSVISLLLTTDAHGLGRDTQTSSSCQIGAIKKGATGKQCDVAIPPACKVATNVSTHSHWTGIEKTGGMSCRFDPKLTDWKTRITGTCSKCLARECTAKFTVYFDCAPSTATP